MQILITGRHIEITEDLQKRLESRIEAIFADTTLKVSSVRVVLDLEKSRCRADFFSRTEELFGAHAVQWSESSQEKFAESISAVKGV